MFNVVQNSRLRSIAIYLAGIVTAIAALLVVQQNWSAGDERPGAGSIVPSPSEHGVTPSMPVTTEPSEPDVQELEDRIGGLRTDVQAEEFVRTLGRNPVSKRHDLHSSMVIWEFDIPHVKVVAWVDGFEQVLKYSVAPTDASIHPRFRNGQNDGRGLRLGEAAFGDLSEEQVNARSVEFGTGPEGRVRILSYTERHGLTMLTFRQGRAAAPDQSVVDNLYQVCGATKSAKSCTGDAVKLQLARSALVVTEFTRETA